jgi:peptidoglycan-associated lipoprotein
MRFLVLAFAPLLVALGCASGGSSTPTPTATAPDPAPAQAQVKDPKPVGVALSLESIYFDTDRAQLRPEAREMLKRYGEQILSHPEWGVLTIEGHCDERGSDEYNLALGERRAAVVERYLLDLGVPASRLNIRSFGEEKPAVAGHDEGAWRYNRRSEITSPSFKSASR